MKEKKKDYIELMMDLIDIYKEYLRKHSDSKLSIDVKNNSINMVLSDNNDIRDEFGIVFDNNERHIYITCCFILLRLLFYRRSKIFNSDKSVTSEKNNDGLIMVSFVDDELFQSMWGMINLYDEDDFYDKVDQSRKIRNKLNRRRFVKELRERINISRKLVGDK